jgi:hypothetical protein
MITPLLANGDPSVHPVARASTTSTPRGGLTANGAVKSPKRTFWLAVFSLRTTSKLALLVSRPHKLPRYLSLVVSLPLLVFLIPAVFSSSAQAEACSNEQLRKAEPYGSRLPDCRAYEQVTPIDKDGHNPSGGVDSVQASLQGERIVFLVPSSLPGGEGASETEPKYLASRGPEAWTTQGLQLRTLAGQQSGPEGWSEDLSQVVLRGPGCSNQCSYLRNSATGLSQLIAASQVTVADFTPDGSRLLFETSTQLLPNAAPGKVNLYEWDATSERLRLAGVLPGPGEVAPAGGSFAGPNAWLTGNTSQGGATAKYYTQNTISSDGKHVFFTAGETAQLYARENGERTVAVPGGHFDAATPDGSAVVVDNGSTLSEYNVDRQQSTALTPAGSEIQGLLGTSNDGGSVYFAANAILATNAGANGSHASIGNCAPGLNENGKLSGGGKGACNLYLWRSGRPLSFIAATSPLEGGVEQGDSQNWYPTPKGSEFARLPGEKTARVTPDGQTLLFSSRAQQTAYANHGSREFYRYDANGERITCVSCDPSGALPSGDANLQSIKPTQFSGEGPALTLTRNLSSDGSRVFFETPDSLLPQDTNGVQDVYEWEREAAGGSSGCQRTSGGFSETSGGCLFLLSTGRSPQPSFFADASLSGDDAFLFTNQALVGQDEDQIGDIYDARVNGGLLAQIPTAALPCANEAACRGPQSQSVTSGAPASSSLTGAGNLPPPALAPTTGV